jgi:hypothetical protein
VRTTYGPLPEVRPAWAAFAVSILVPVVASLTIFGLIAVWAFVNSTGTPTPEPPPGPPPRERPVGETSPR